MKRFACLALLMVLSSSANAAGSYSFVVRGHRISIEAPRHCRSLSCVSIHEVRLDAAPDAASAKPVAAAPAQAQALASAPPQAQPATRAPAQVAAPPSIPPANKPSIQPVACASPPPAAPLASATRPVAAPPPAKIQPSEILTMAPAVAAPVPQPPAAAQPAPAPSALKISRDAEDEPEQTPLGDWQTEGSKGLVRIEQCGRALCGYVLNPSSYAVGETVLINMKPKAASQWSGNIFSRDSGNTYYATMKMKGPNSLRVEACALGSFFCSGNVWSRVAAPSEQLMTSGRVRSVPPRS
jgi:uncharacterized protein (DUF2147 family)